MPLLAFRMMNRYEQALNAQAAGEIVTGLEQEIGKVIVGQHTLIRRMLTALFAAIPFRGVEGTRAHRAAATCCSKASPASPRR